MAFGACLPLSQAVPLMPVADALAAASTLDHGQRIESLLAGGPAKWSEVASAAGFRHSRYGSPLDLPQIRFRAFGHGLGTE